MITDNQHKISLIQNKKANIDEWIVKLVSDF